MLFATPNSAGICCRTAWLPDRILSNSDEQLPCGRNETPTNAKRYAVNRDGTEKWRFETGKVDDFDCSPAIGEDGTIYFGSKDGNLYALYGESGGLAETPWPMHGGDLRHTGAHGSKLVTTERPARGRSSVVQSDERTIIVCVMDSVMDYFLLVFPKIHFTTSGVKFLLI